MVSVLPASSQLRRQPDLIVGEIRTTGAPLLSGANFIVPLSVRIENPGSAPAGPFKVAVMKALESPPGAETEVPFSASGILSGLAAKNKMTVSGNVTIAPRSEAGKKVKIRTFVDSLAQVGESDERNNLSPWLEVQLPELPVEAARPRREVKSIKPFTDLTLSPDDINVYPPIRLAGADNIGVQPTVKNLGSVAARNVEVELRVSRPPSTAVVMTQTAVIPAIAARGSELASFGLDSRRFGMGDYDLQVLLDKSRTIAESREDNNEARKSFHVRGPELSVHAEEIEIGPFQEMFHELSFSIPVHNTGDGEARNVHVQYRIVDQDGRTLFSLNVATATIDRIPAGGWRTFADKRSIDGLHVNHTYDLIITVTANCYEEDRTNNSARRLLTF